MNLLVKWRPGWRTARRVVQLGCLAAFLVLFRRTEYDGFTPIPEAANGIFRLDPLVAASTALATRKWIPGLVLPALVVLASTWVLGRFFCGWICPLGTILDGFGRIVGRARGPRHRGTGRPTPTPTLTATPTSPPTPPNSADASSPESSIETIPSFGTRGPSFGSHGPSFGAHAPSLSKQPRKWKYAILTVVLVAAFCGLPLTGWVDPFGILVRALATAIDPIFRFFVGAPFEWLYSHAPESVTEWSEPVYEYLRNHILPLREGAYLLASASLVIFLGILFLERFERRFWCRYLCPTGALLAIPARWSLLRRKPLRSCRSCGDCARECRMGAFDTDSHMSPESCNLCLDCVDSCPTGIASFRFARTKTRPAAFDPTRRLLLGSAGLGVALAAASRIEGRAAERSIPAVLRPPGAANEDRFLDLCVRCGLCLKVCPTGALQPTGFESGLAGVFSPRVVPRIGQCEYNCTLCGEVCPTGAIPRLDEAAKHAAIIGKAEFDTSRCLPYARGEPCIVCEEHCPVAEKAIQVRDVEVLNIRGEKLTLKQPWVAIERCVGCGICETKCPLLGAAGIRVVPTRNAAVTPEMAGKSG